MVTILFFICILTACEGSNDLSDNTSTHDTGSVAFNVVWNQGLGSDTDYQAMAVVCGNEPEQVSTVRAAIVNTETSVVKQGGPWDCTPPSGTIQGVPIGSDYTILFYGFNESGRTTYSGVKLGISVNTGINDIGTIDANQFFTQITSPADESSNIDPDLARFEWDYAPGAAGYQLWISESDNIFSDPLIFDCDGLDFTVPAGILDANTTYYWTVWSIDIYENRSWWYRYPLSFTTASATMDDNYENNDSIDAAFDLPRNVDLSSIDGPGIAVSQNFDFYKMVVPYNSANLVISCTFIHNFGDIDMELFDAGGNFLDGSWTTFDNEYIYFEHAGGPATYYVVVGLFDDESSPSNIYDLKWTAQ